MKLIILLILLLAIPLAYADDLVITSVTSIPEQIQPGETTQISIVLKNIGNNDIENINVNLGLSQVPFAPVRSATEQIIEKIKEDRTSTVLFEVVALPEAEPKIYKIPLKVSYATTIKETLISLKVSAKPELNIALEESELTQIGDSGKVIIRFVNIGLTEIKFLIATLQPSANYEILSTNTAYIGDVSPDDFETAEFNIYTKSKISSLSIKVQYKDSNNQEYTETVTIPLKIYTQEEAKALGFNKSNNTTFIIIVIIIIMILYIIYRRRKKR